MHRRIRPKKHQFNYDCFIFCIDLDEADRLDKRLSLFGHNKRNAYSLHVADHLDEGRSTVKENILSFLKSKGMDHPIARIELVTNLRTWGHVFNPVSFYFCYDENDDAICSVAEVANTFHEQKLYLLGQETLENGRFKKSLPKLFYISPYSDLDTHLNFNLSAPEDRIRLVITENDSDGEYFYSSLTGESSPLTNGALIRYSIRFPFMTLKVITAIHWEALRLYLKKVPFYKKSHRPDLQVGTRPYLPKEKRKSA